MDDYSDEKVNLDELYDRRREIEIIKIKTYNKILARIHKKIKIISQRNCETKLFYLVPEFDFAVPAYNVNTCISYLIQKLQDNGFNISYTHPNLLFISWGHYIPAYKRDEIKKQTGLLIDGFGNIIPKNKDDTLKLKDDISPNDTLLNLSRKTSDKGDDKTKKIYNDINNYKPSGIYNLDLLNKIKDKTT